MNVGQSVSPGDLHAFCAPLSFFLCFSGMPGCVAAWCTNSSSKGYKMCNFPRDKERRDAWVRNMNRQNWSPTPHSALCEVHFAPDMWERVRIDGKKKLKACAVPTIFVANCTYVLLNEKSETSAKRKNVLDSVAILRRKPSCSTKKGGGSQKGCLRRSQVASNEETNNNNNEPQGASENMEKSKEITKNTSRAFGDPPESIGSES